VIPVLLIGLFLAAWLYREHMFQRERDAWARERSTLLNRINPATAQAVDPVEDEELPQMPASSEEWWAHHDEVMS
jgi:hypothetical protein